MEGFGSYSTPSGRMFAVAWVGMAVIMSLSVAVTTAFDIPIQAVYVFAAGLTLRELLGIAAWAIQRQP